MSYLDNQEQRNFYVYGLFRGDELEPFYIGKGNGNRMHDHLRPSSLKSKSHKNNIINKSLSEGIPIIPKKIHDNLSEKEANSIEIYEISMYGRLDIGTGILVNHTDGGEGTVGLIRTEDHLQKISNSSLMSLSRFIEKAKNVHGDTYNYEHVTLENNFSTPKRNQNRKALDIICKKHGKFSQTIQNHCFGLGCPACGRNAPITTNTEFLRIAKELYNDDYLYVFKNEETIHSLMDYSIKIICKKHGNTNQLAHSHINGHRSICCYSENRKSRPWENPTILNNKESVKIWIQADKIYSLWDSNDKCGDIALAKIYNKNNCTNLKRSCFTTMIKKFNSGWEPYSDTSWINFKDKHDNK